LFMDKEYGEIEMVPGGGAPFAVSLSIAGRVTSVNQAGQAVIDAGYKAMATDAGPALVSAGAPKDATYQFMGDEHGGSPTTGPARARRAGQADRAALRSHGQSARPFPRQGGRPPRRHLADRRAGVLGRRSGRGPTDAHDRSRRRGDRHEHRLLPRQAGPRGGA